MTTLNFVLLPEACTRFVDTLVCLSKFGEAVNLEATRESLVLAAVNTSKTAAATFTFDKKIFFQSYRLGLQSTLEANHRVSEPHFSCEILNRVLLSAFKTRAPDVRDRDTAIERCEVSLQDQIDKTSCRLTVKMIHRHGVKKTHKLTFEDATPLRVPFDRASVRSQWTLSSSILRAYSEFFGMRTEHLDMFLENGRMTFTSYAEKIVHGKEILRQPLQTSVALDVHEFEDFEVAEKEHVGISVKDFRAMVAHAESLRLAVTALYSYPTKPLRFCYGDRNLRAEITLMTIGDYRGATTAPASGAHRGKPLQLPSRGGDWSQRTRQDETRSMPPPPAPPVRSLARETDSQRIMRPFPETPAASINEDSLFVPENDDEEDERRWGEAALDDDEGHLRWDSTAFSLQRDSFATGAASVNGSKRPREPDDDSELRVEPTQRLSQIRGLFDE